MKPSKTLYVIADGGRARFVARGEDGDFHTIASFVSSEVHERCTNSAPINRRE